MNLVIAIESSCDETSIALLEQSDAVSGFMSFVSKVNVVDSIISSQIDVHAQYGGVVPEIGARKHADQIHWIFESLIARAYPELAMQEVLSRVSSIAVTTEPGLVSALRVGVEFGKTLRQYIYQLTNNNIEITQVNHLHGHVASSFLNYQESQIELDDDQIFPHLHLLVSGGNSQIIFLRSWNDWEIVGQTLDDAAGESLDKIGRMLGLPYPGGVYCAKIAGMRHENILNLPVGMKSNPSLNFSFSGLKTAVRYLVQDSTEVVFEEKLVEDEVQQLLRGEFDNPKLEYINKVCLSAQTVVVEQLMNKFGKGLKMLNPVSIGLSGGVSANRLLRSRFNDLAHTYDVEQFIPDLTLTGDNAVMIGLAGMLKDYYLMGN